MALSSLTYKIGVAVVKWIRFKTNGLVPEVLVQANHIIMIHPLKKGGCRITLDPSIHEVTEFDTPMTMDEIWLYYF